MILHEQSYGAGTNKRRCRDRTINSIVLLSNGISFAIQIVVFLFLGSFAGKFSTTLIWFIR